MNIMFTNPIKLSFFFDQKRFRYYFQLFIQLIRKFIKQLYAYRKESEKKERTICIIFIRIDLFLGFDFEMNIVQNLHSHLKFFDAGLKNLNQ